MESDLRNRSIYQFQQQQGIFKIDYINANNEIKRVEGNVSDLNSSDLRQKLLINDLSIVYLAYEQAIKEYPLFATYPLQNSSVYAPYYVLQFSSDFSISGKFTRSGFIFNAPIESLPTINPGANATGEGVLVGGFSTFTNYSDPRFIRVLERASEEFPELVGASVTSVQSQVVAGTNFLIWLSKPVQGSAPDIYELRIWHTIQNTTSLIEGKKNNNWIYKDYYNYNIDELFMSNYHIVEESSRVANIPPIERVFLKVVNGTNHYTVHYSDKEFAEFSVQQSNGQARFGRYMVDGEDISEVLAGTLPQNSIRSNQVLLGALQSQYQGFTNARIK